VEYDSSEMPLVEVPAPSCPAAGYVIGFIKIVHIHLNGYTAPRWDNIFRIFNL
jgi:hypothetical protein